MTDFSVNLNKIALLRNARGGDFPNLFHFARRCLDLGAHGITLHPRPDQRHARYADLAPIADLCREYGREFNIEGFPTRRFLDEVREVQPAQCTLVPDDPAQLTSDHGWNLARSDDRLADAIRELKAAGIRVSLFVDATSADLAAAKNLGADRVELYTGPYANGELPWESYRLAALQAQQAGLGVNAGHDLNLDNLARFLEIPGILEVSIGHAFLVECIETGIASVVHRYLQICAGAQPLADGQL